jgi:cytidylate kinase
MMIITIDGPAGVGKTTISRSVAEKTNLPYLDSGAMFRCLALLLGDGAWNWSEDRLDQTIAGYRFTLTGTGAQTSLLVNNSPLPEAIRSEQTGVWASHLGKLPVIRKRLKHLQREIGNNDGLVAEGRDMGTVVFPDADAKFFLDADPEERARRRWLQFKAMSLDAHFDALLKDMKQRDRQDQSRSTAPLVAARDAVIINTTSLSQEAVIQAILEALPKKNRP